MKYQSWNKPKPKPTLAFMLGFFVCTIVNRFGVPPQFDLPPPLREREPTTGILPPPEQERLPGHCLKYHLARILTPRITPTHGWGNR